MRTVLRCAALAVVVAAALACDSEQPLQGGAVEAVVVLDTSESVVPNADIWEVWEDVGGDGVPDRQKREFLPNGPLVYQCEERSSTLTRYPWNIAVEISVLHRGASRPEIVTTTLGLEQRFAGITRFDPTPSTPVGDLPPDIVANRYPIHGVRVSKAHADWVNHWVNLCSGSPETEPLVANLGQLGNPATVTLNPGDTLLVQARKATQVQNFILPGLFPNPILTGAVFVGGAGVATNGTTQTTTADGDGMSFSYTLN